MAVATSTGKKRPHSAVVSIGLALFLAFVGLGAFLSERRTSVVGFDRPVVTTIFYHDRILTLSLVRGQGWWKTLHNRMLEIPADPLDQAIAAYGAALSTISGDAERADRVALEGRRAIALAVAGRKSEADAALSRLARLQPSGEQIARIIAFALAGGSQPTTPADLQVAISSLTVDSLDQRDWTTDQLRMAFFGRTREPTAAKAVMVDLQKRAERLAMRADVLAFVLVFVGCSALVFLTIAISRGASPFQPFGESILPPPWSMLTGLEVVLRVTVGAILGSVLAGVLSQALGLKLDILGWTVAVVAALYFGRKSLSSPHGLTVASAFGLSLPSRGKLLVASTLVLIVLEQGIAWMSDALLSELSTSSSWTELVDEDLLRGDLLTIVSGVAIGVVMAPIAEEITYRSILFGSLRTRLGALSAAMISAAVFALAHVYSLEGTAYVFVSAVVSALVYERTRSLVPCIVAHAVNNAFAAGSNLLLR